MMPLPRRSPRGRTSPDRGPQRALGEKALDAVGRSLYGVRARQGTAGSWPDRGTSGRPSLRLRLPPRLRILRPARRARSRCSWRSTLAVRPARDGRGRARAVRRAGRRPFTDGLPRAVPARLPARCRRAIVREMRDLRRDSRSPSCTPKRRRLSDAPRRPARRRPSWRARPEEGCEPSRHPPARDAPRRSRDAWTGSSATRPRPVNWVGAALLFESSLSRRHRRGARSAQRSGRRGARRTSGAMASPRPRCRGSPATCARP